MREFGRGDHWPILAATIANDCAEFGTLAAAIWHSPPPSPNPRTICHKLLLGKKKSYRMVASTLGGFGLGGSQNAEPQSGQSTAANPPPPWENSSGRRSAPMIPPQAPPHLAHNSPNRRRQIAANRRPPNRIVAQNSPPPGDGPTPIRQQVKPPSWPSASASGVAPARPRPARMRGPLGSAGPFGNHLTSPYYLHWHRECRIA
jgi:hypothetical protein